MNKNVLELVLHPRHVHALSHSKTISHLLTQPLMRNVAKSPAFRCVSRYSSSASPADDRKHTIINPLSLVSSLKSSSSLSSGQQLHAVAFKSGLDQTNIFVRNSLSNLYSKFHRLSSAESLFRSSPLRDVASWNIMLVSYVKTCRFDDARKLFDEMPRRDCVSFTTMIMGLSQNGLLDGSLLLFRRMVAEGVMPNEVTLATVLSSCSRSRSVGAEVIHSLAFKIGLDAFVLVGTNLVHWYSVESRLEESRAVFDGLVDKNVVTWNAMLNGYAKAGDVDSARDLFERIPVKDLVSWSTMIDAYLRVDRLEEALVGYRDMLQEDVTSRPNEVMLVDMVSACARFCAVREGSQLHGVVLKAGLNCHAFVQATLIHFYAACRKIDQACLQFQLGSQSNVSCWNALITGFLRNDMVDSANQLFDEMPERDVVSWTSLIAGYVQHKRPDVSLDLFHDMMREGVKPNEITFVSVLSAVASCGTLEQGNWIHNYILTNKSNIPLTDNLIAGLIDMYAKRGSINCALQVFSDHRNSAALSSVSTWNALICGLAMHGHAETCLSIFSDLQERSHVKPNSITFIGVLSACCHAGLVAAGRWHFEHMKSVYGIEPSIKHYGCMVDLLGRAGCFEEAEGLIKAMPMNADVMIWGSMLAAARTYGNEEVGERAAKELAKLDPSHAAGRVLLSNMYADVGKWDGVVDVRKEMHSMSCKKAPGYSGIL